MKGFTLLGFPRQGTDFFMRCISHGLRYRREYFNPCVSWHDPLIREWFGCERHPRGIFLRPESEFDEMFSAWGEKFDLNKEVFSFFKSDLFKSRSHVVYLFRDRKHTFPSSIPSLMLPIFDAFVSASFNSETVWSEASRYVSMMGVEDPKVKQVLIHEAMWRLQLWSAPCPVIFYSDLMEMDESELRHSLGSVLPNWIDLDMTVGRIVAGRWWRKGLREGRWRDFVAGSTVERDLEALSGFLDSLIGPMEAKRRIRVRFL